MEAWSRKLKDTGASGPAVGYGTHVAASFATLWPVETKFFPQERAEIILLQNRMMSSDH
jgi:hypothetical protein